MLALDPQAAITQYGHRILTVQQGLPQNSVPVTLQTHEGHLWIGTQEGLVRYDGARAVVFDQNNVPALKDHRVLALCEDRDLNLWIGTRGGGLVRYRDGVFTRFDTSSGLPNDRVRSVFQDRQGRLWVGTDGGLSRFEQDRFVMPPGLSSRPYVVMAMAEGKDGLWLATDGDGVLRLNDGIESFTTHQGLSSDAVRALHVSTDGTLWVGTRTGLDRFENGRFTNVKTLPAGGSAVAALVQDRDGNLWVGTRGSGLLRLSQGVWSTFSERDGLSSNVVLSVYEDREGSIWVGTEGAGVNQLRDVRFKNWGKPEGLAHEMLVAIYQDRQDDLWFGSYGGGLHRLRERRFSTFTTAQGLSSNLVVSLLQDRAGALWVGTDGGGLNRFEHGKFEHFGLAQGLPNERVIALHEDRAGALWIGTYGGALARLKDGRITTHGRSLGLSSELVLSIAEDRQGRLWVGTDGGGLNVFEEGRFKTYTTEQGLAHDTVFRILEDDDGTLWIGTYGGLSVLRDGVLKSFGRAHGLFDERIFQILDDGQGNLWMSCNKGIFRVKKRDIDAVLLGRARAFTSVVYGTGDGLRSSECNGNSQPAGWRARDGTLWFPTTRGAVQVDPGRIRPDSQPPPVTIEELAVDKQNYALSGTADVPPGRGEIEVRYAALTYLEPERVAFKYRLEGFDQGWVDAGSRRVAYYTNIPPGSYRFVVLAANGDGVWNETGATLAIVLRPHFYRAPWFYALCLLGVSLCIWAGHRLRVRRLAVNERRLAALVDERTRELQEANRQLALFSDLDAVTGIANRRHFNAWLDKEWRRIHRAGLPLALLMIDIDRFKAYNDTYGHQPGDECLHAVAQALRSGLHRPGDLCARYGGEEFGVILPGTHLEGARAVAEGLRRAIEGIAIPHAGSASCFVTISVGVAETSPESPLSLEDLLLAADRALYDAKRTGRNRVSTVSVPAAN